MIRQRRIDLGVGALWGAMMSGVMVWGGLGAGIAYAGRYEIGNEWIQRVVCDDEACLKTERVVNRQMQRAVVNEGAEEFKLRLVKGGQLREWGAKDFVVMKHRDWVRGDDRGVEFVLEGKERGGPEVAPVSVVVRYWVDGKQPVIRKCLKLVANEEVTIERVEVESLKLAGAYAPYRPQTIVAAGAAQWSPPLGQPIYTKESGLWLGMEFPGARNEVKEGQVGCSYLMRVTLAKGQEWESYAVAMGSADDEKFVKEAFFEYIDQTRVRPLRLQTQYNSWFDFGGAVKAESFNQTVAKVNQELCQKRGVAPLSAYVIDDGWQDVKVDWSKGGVWPVNSKFDKDFGSNRQVIGEAKSKLGLWVSPGCVFGGQGAVPAMKAAGWKSLGKWMSMTDRAYMDGLEKRLVELAGSPVAYFKLDGIFGHLNNRVFDIEGFDGGEPVLNEGKYDEGKERYLSMGSERLMQMFKKMGEANPEVYITISNGAYLSPWWLQSVDAVWMINAGDAAGGADRTGELVYRDSAYYRLASEEGDATQFPLHSIFNHEPKKTKTGESADEFRRYLYMNLSRGTGFVELYLKTDTLSQSDWDVLAEGMKWVRKVFPNFKRAQMIGGNPKKGEVYGYSGWTARTGYVALHNPSSETKRYTIEFNRGLGMTKEGVKGRYRLGSPMAEDLKGLESVIQGGQQLTIELPAKAIRVLEFSAE